MAITTGKVVGARLPLPDYLDIVQKAADLKMTISDYVILRLYAPIDPSAAPLLQARQQIEQLTAQVASLEALRAELTQKAQTWQQQVATLQQDQQETARRNQAMAQANAAQQGEAAQRSQAVAQERAAQQQAQIDALTRQLAIEKSDRLVAQNRLVDLRQALADVHNNSGLLGTMAEKYWEIVDEFVPRKP